jgi:hypothetical protein
MTGAADIAKLVDNGGWCDDCHGPTFPQTAWQLVIQSYAYDLWLALPLEIAFSRFGMAILPYAGSHAFCCRCPEKVRP